MSSTNQVTLGLEYNYDKLLLNKRLLRISYSPGPQKKTPETQTLGLSSPAHPRNGYDILS